MILFRKKAPRRDGLLHLLVTSLWICVLLAFNGTLVAVVHSQADLSTGVWIRYPRLSQAAVFATPLVLIFIELWLLDWFVDFTSNRQRPEAESGEDA